jgi:hypothetical protein
MRACPRFLKKELRNNVADVLRRAEAGEEFTITWPAARSHSLGRFSAAAG